MPRARRRPPVRGYALVVPGLEALAAGELAQLGATVSETLARFDRRDSILIFEIADPAPLLRAGMIEDVFLLLADLPVPRSATAPKLVARAIMPETLAAAMLVHHALTRKRGGRSFATVARVAGRQQFRREQLDDAIARRAAALLPRWRRADSGAGIELWAHVIGDRAIAGLRLSGDELAQRRYKRAHLPASVKPTVARALAVLTAPRHGDVVLDPMAGAGTILRERADAAPARLVLGGDIDAAALGAARANIGRVRGLALWDAAHLPVRSGVVDAIITNPPYGRKHEAGPGVAPLYRAMLREAARVLRPGGRAVVLTGEPDSLRAALPRAIEVRARHRLLLRGLPVTAFVLVRT